MQKVTNWWYTRTATLLFVTQRWVTSQLSVKSHETNNGWKEK